MVAFIAGSTGKKPTSEEVGFGFMGNNRERGFFWERSNAPRHHHKEGTGNMEAGLYHLSPGIGIEPIQTEVSRLLTTVIVSQGTVKKVFYRALPAELPSRR